MSGRPLNTAYESLLQNFNFFLSFVCSRPPLSDNQYPQGKHFDSFLDSTQKTFYY